MADQDEHSTPPSPNEEEELAQPSPPEQHDDDDESEESEEQTSSDSPNDEAEPNLQANPTTQTPNESSSESPESAQSKEETEEETGEEEEGEEEEEEVSFSPADQQQPEEPKEQETVEEPEVKEEKEEEAELALSPGESTDTPVVDETPVAVEPVDDGHPFHLATTPSNQQDETPEEQKSQRDLDDEEIPPPPVVLSGRNSFSSEKRLSQSSQPPVNDEHGDEHHDDAAEEKENVDPSKTNGEIHLEKIPFEEIEKKEVEADNEVLPPLEPTSIAQELLHDQHFVDETITTVSPTTTTTTVEAPVEKKEEEFPWEDVLSNHTLMKQTLRKGGTNSRPTRSQLVTVNYSLSLLDEKSGETNLIEEKRNEEFFVGETDIIAAIDLAVQSMDEGELAVVVADVRHVYGNEGFVEKGIPPKNEENDYKMQIQLELIQFRPAPNVELLSADERILWAEKKRQNGNVHYRRKEYSPSLQCYRGSLRFLDLENNPLRHDSNDEERKRVVDQFIQVQNNVAQVNLTLKRYDLCLNAVENVLRVDPTNIKALFRQGKSLFELGQYDRCQTPLKTILQLDPNHSDRDQINKMIAFAEQKLANYKQNEKDIYRRMFQGSTSPTTTSSSTSSTTTTGAAATSKTPRKIVLKKSSSSNFWTFVGLSTVTVSLVGLFAYLKYRPAS